MITTMPCPSLQVDLSTTNLVFVALVLGGWNWAWPWPHSAGKGSKVCHSVPAASAVVVAVRAAPAGVFPGPVAG